MIPFAIMIWLGWAVIIALILFAIYKILSMLLDRYLIAKHDHTAAIREQNAALKKIAAALKEGRSDVG